jgi:hypothetical protein
MNGTKVNTNDGAMSSSSTKKPANSTAGNPIHIGVEHGKLVFDDLFGLADHARMVSVQIEAMLAATYGEGDMFEHMSVEARQNYMWHVSQLHRQMDAALNLFASEVTA